MLRGRPRGRILPPHPDGVERGDDDAEREPDARLGVENVRPMAGVEHHPEQTARHERPRPPEGGRERADQGYQPTRRRDAEQSCERADQVSRRTVARPRRGLRRRLSPDSVGSRQRRAPSTPRRGFPTPDVLAWLAPSGVSGRSSRGSSSVPRRCAWRPSHTSSRLSGTIRSRRQVPLGSGTSEPRDDGGDVVFRSGSEVPDGGSQSRGRGRWRSPEPVRHNAPARTGLIADHAP